MQLHGLTVIVTGNNKKGKLLLFSSYMVQYFCYLMHLLLVSLQNFLDDALSEIHFDDIFNLSDAWTPVIWRSLLSTPPRPLVSSPPLPIPSLCLSIYPSLSSPSLLLSLCVFLQRLPVFEHQTLLTYWPSTPHTHWERSTGKLATEGMDLWFPVWVFFHISGITKCYYKALGHWLVLQQRRKKIHVH